MELNGISCLEIEELAIDKPQIVCSCSFSYRLTEYQELSQASTLGQYDLFEFSDDGQATKNKALMNIVDQINNRYFC